MKSALILALVVGGIVVLSQVFDQSQAVAPTQDPWIEWAAQVKRYWRPLTPEEQQSYSAAGLLPNTNLQWVEALDAYLLPDSPDTQNWFFWKPSEQRFYMVGRAGQSS